MTTQKPTDDGARKGIPAELLNTKGELIIVKRMRARDGATWGVTLDGAWRRLPLRKKMSKKQRLRARRWAREGGAL